MADYGRADYNPYFASYLSFDVDDASMDADPSAPPPWTPDCDRPARRLNLTRHPSLPSLYSPPTASLFGPAASLQANDDPTPAPEPSGSYDARYAPSGGVSRRTDAVANAKPEGHYDPVRETASVRRLPRAEKDADDTSNPPHSLAADQHRRDSAMVTSLSKLFAAQSTVSPEHSRQPSYITPLRPLSYARSTLQADIATLPDHVYERGFLEGRHSDITVNAFGRQYKLHRLILDRLPFFRSALSEPWFEARSRETTLHPEDMDSAITRSSFELALKRLYGCNKLDEEEGEAVGLFATGYWLEMHDLVDASIESLLRQMTPQNLSSLMKLVTSNNYGRAGDKIIASAKSMLCRDGWRMPLRYWDGVPADIIREIVGGDGFFVDDEWERWVLAKRLLDRRLRAGARSAGLVDASKPSLVRKAPDSDNLMAVRFDAVYRRNGVGHGAGIPDSLQPWVSLYTHSDVEPLLVLLDEGIHYIHLDFEQLQTIRGAKDAVGLPLMPEKVMSDALWQQMELRQRVVNVSELDEELGISIKYSGGEPLPVREPSADTTMRITSPSHPSVEGKGKDVDEEAREPIDLDSGSWDGNGKPRKFWIPSSDCNIIMGGNAEPVIATSNNTTIQRHLNRSSATLGPEDVQWAADFAAVTAQPRPFSRGGEIGVGLNDDSRAGEVRYTHLPPFRFAAEFPNPRGLKEKKRVYSRTVFYAGSWWNIYIQKVASSRTKQLGVYLHRAKERDADDAMVGAAGLAQGSVDERIGQLERDMIMNAERNDRRQRRRTNVGGVERAGSADDAHTHPSSHGVGVNPAQQSSMRGVASSSARPHATVDSYNFSDAPSNRNSGEIVISDTEDSDAETILTPRRRSHVPALPPYVDARPTIRTYFKIYSPSRGGRMLSVYESAPDTFNFSQSWGWKSSTLMLDEGLLSGGNNAGGSAGPTVGSEDQDQTTADGAGVKSKVEGDGKLRFMVVIGNV